MSDPTPGRPRLLQGLGRNVVVLGLVSLLTDISHEMLYPVVPLFLTTVLGAPMAAVGLIEGVAECTASLLKVLSGWYSDRIRRRRPFLFAGYALSAASKPLLALAASWHLVLASRLLDRLGKGVRTSARDSLLAASCDPAHRGKAFGVHRAMDTAGAFLGPLLALLLLSRFHTSYRTVFLIALIPALAGLAALCGIRGHDPIHVSSNGDRGGTRGHDPIHALPNGDRVPEYRISPSLRRFLFVVGLFAVGNSSDVFLLLRAKDVGFSQSLVLMVYVFYNLAHALAAVPVGWLSDRLGRRGIIVGGFCTFAIVYLGFALTPSAALIWPLFALYGLYGAAAEGVAKAYVADLSTPANRGTALGLLQTVQGLMAFAASLAAGFLWTHIAPAAPFLYGAACALLAAGLFLLIGRARPLLKPPA